MTATTIASPAAARADLADKRTQLASLTARHQDAERAVHVAEQHAATVAASPSSDDDADALRAVSDARLRRDALAEAIHRADADVQAAERALDAAERGDIAAKAHATFDAIRDKLPDLEQAVRVVADLAGSIDRDYHAARTQLVQVIGEHADMPFSLYAARAVRQALVAAGVDVREDGPRPDDPSAIADTLGGRLNNAVRHADASRAW